MSILIYKVHVLIWIDKIMSLLILRSNLTRSPCSHRRMDRPLDHFRQRIAMLPEQPVKAVFLFFLVCFSGPQQSSPDYRGVAVDQNYKREENLKQEKSESNVETHIDQVVSEN